MEIQSTSLSNNHPSCVLEFLNRIIIYLDKQRLVNKHYKRKGFIRPLQQAIKVVRRAVREVKQGWWMFKINTRYNVMYIAEEKFLQKANEPNGYSIPRVRWVAK